MQILGPSAGAFGDHHQHWQRTAGGVHDVRRQRVAGLAVLLAVRAAVAVIVEGPNHYSRKIHARMVEGKAYGCAFDNVGGFESLVHDVNSATAYTTLTSY
ncbi:beta-1,3-glucanase family protein [Nonomuraea endophytica]|uniref:beta-1,3-glucanase family protein n=1 Tax=Nonomuraea endophytica TaxID=714136 RepID=UPI0037CA62CD